MAAQDSYPGVPPSQASWGRDSQGNPVPVVVVHAPPGGEAGNYGGGASSARRSNAILWMGILIGGLAIACVLLGFAYLDARTRADKVSTAEGELIIARNSLKEEQGRVQTWRDAYFSLENDYRATISDNDSIRRRYGMAPVKRQQIAPPKDVPRRPSR